MGNPPHEVFAFYLVVVAAGGAVCRGVGVDRAELQALNDQAASGTLEIVPPEAPLVLFVWGRGRVVPVRVQSASGGAGGFFGSGGEGGTTGTGDNNGSGSSSKCAISLAGDSGDAPLAGIGMLMALALVRRRRGH